MYDGVHGLHTADVRRDIELLGYYRENNIYTSMITEAFGYKWNTWNHTKWDTSWYDKAYFGESAVNKITIDEPLHPVLNKLVNKNTIREASKLPEISDIKEILRLSIVVDPKFFNRGEIEPVDPKDATQPGRLVLKPYSCGEVTGPGFNYGTFTWRVIMPEYPQLWPALWLSAEHSWPPEIDVVEGYTEERGNYIRSYLQTSLETNAHYRVGGGHKCVGAKAMCYMTYKRLHRMIDTWSCVWTPDYVKIIFNGQCIRTIRDKKLLDDLNDRHSMCPIMNMMITDKFELKDINDNPHMDIIDFKYEPLGVHKLGGPNTTHVIHTM